MPTKERMAKMRHVIANRQPDLAVVCENIHDPHNVSAILRSCDAVGVKTVHLLYNDTEFPKLGKKSSASGKKWIDIVRHRTYEDLQKQLHGEGKRIYATYLDESARSIYDIDWTQAGAIVMGNEHRGASAEMLKIADETVYIPMSGMIQSLNVSVATAVTLYEAFRQRQVANLYPTPRLSPQEKDELLLNWIER